MGENAFALWCANEGLSANRSAVDKTGWDFFVEFPMATSTIEIHRPALECRVQVKATDHRKRKLNIPLSNLQRLATAPTPCFYIFLEFDGEDTVQRAFLVHVDNDLISRVLRKAYEIGSSARNKKLNKTTLIIHYGQEHLISPPYGSSLRSRLKEIIGLNLQDYIQRKKEHLLTTGYEEGCGEITITVEGEAAFRRLIDMSIGVKTDVSVSAFQGFHTRFGIKNSTPFADAINGRLELLPHEPVTSGFIQFRKEKYGPALTFQCSVFSSPLNAIAPESWQKIRIETEIFDITIAPFLGSASYKFTSSSQARHIISELRNAVQLLSYFSLPGNKTLGQLRANDWPLIEFSTTGCGQEFVLTEELQALNCALRIISTYEINETIEVSLQEVSINAQEIIQLYAIFDEADRVFKVEFSMEDRDINPPKESACAFFVATRIGDFILGAFFVLFGRIGIDANKGLTLLSNKKSIERMIILQEGDRLGRSEFLEVADEIIQKYKTTHEVLILFPNHPSNAPEDSCN